MTTLLSQLQTALKNEGKVPAKGGGWKTLQQIADAEGKSSKTVSTYVRRLLRFKLWEVAWFPVETLIGWRKTPHYRKIRKRK